MQLSKRHGPHCHLSQPQYIYYADRSEFTYNQEPLLHNLHTAPRKITITRDISQRDCLGNIMQFFTSKKRFVERD